ncbi:ATP-binding cassette domain-containing protein [Arthrobacter castelli]|uniref:ATP-binding cassette domain-containing protein n=1 Tax=Arthrobacter castelli TaxID=271431 RepID=UPI000559FE70|nr:ATP-binding cassette domain-containing protein [Arthrobacter castelli]
MNEARIVTDELTKNYGERTAVDAVSLRVEQGEVYGFLGPNGAGKTTTLRMVLGLVRPTSGTVEILGSSPGDPAVLRRVGSLVEEPGFYPYLSGRDNLRVLAHYNGLGNQQVEDVLEQVELRSRGSERFKTYSLGMKQRLGVAAALLGDPQLLILDEPTNGLDPAGMADMRALIRRVAEFGRTVLLSSHLLGEVQQICDRVGVISDGRLLEEGTVADLRGASAIRVVASPVEAAEQVVEQLFGPDAIARQQDGSLQLDVDADRPAEITAALVHAGVEVREIRPVERTLEEVFLEMTGTAKEPMEVTS